MSLLCLRLVVRDNGHVRGRHDAALDAVPAEATRLLDRAATYLLIRGEHQAALAPFKRTFEVRRNHLRHRNDRTVPAQLLRRVRRPRRGAELSTALLAERFTRQRLLALAKVEGKHDAGVSVVLFLCTHNAGRSQMALGFFTHLAGDRAIAWVAEAPASPQCNK